MIIRGYDAISAAKELDLPLGKYSEQSNRGFRLDLSIEEADEIAVEDQNLIFLDLRVQNLTVEQLVTLALALGGERGRSYSEIRDRFAREGDDDRAEIFGAIAKRWADLKSKSH